MQEQISNISWRVDGKVKAITMTTGSSKKNLTFDYDAMGHRIAKHQLSNSNVLEKSTYYVLDAQGNVMSTYERVISSPNIYFTQREKHIYGSSRVGVMNDSIALLGSQNATYSQSTWTHIIGKRNYELQNHLGNVLSVISDKPIPHVSTGTTVDYFLADIRQATDYSPFGVQLSGRNFVKSGGKEFRYGFNDMEQDDDIKGDGNSYDFGARMLDPRLGRWLSLDPYSNDLSSFSPYMFVNDDPIRYIDPDGKFLIDVHKRTMRAAFDNSKLGKTWISKSVNKNGKLYTTHPENPSIKKDIISFRKEIIGSSLFLSHHAYIGSVVSPDVKSLPWYAGGDGEASKEKEHFDNMNYQQILKNYNDVYSSMISAAESYKAGKLSATELGKKMGPYFHALQDLYSHSNYVELYVEIYGKTNMDDIPTFGEVMSDAKYIRFKILLEKKLKTGTYPGEGEGSHKDMNHDLGEGSGFSLVPEVKNKVVNWFSRAAEKVATKSSTFMVNEIEKIMNEKK